MAEGSSISAGTTIRGRIIADGDLEIAGHVEGTVTASGDLTVAEGATIKVVDGEVSGATIAVCGAVNGSLRGADRLILEAGARVVGDLSAPTVGIRSGALLRGRVETAATSPRTARVAAQRTVSTAASAPPKAKTTSRRGATAKGSAKKSARKAPAPVMPKAATKGTRAGAAKKTTKKKSSKRAAPAPTVPALRKRTKRAVKRRAR